VEEVINALSEDSKKEVTREEIIKDLTKFMDYGVPIAQAKLTLIKKYGGIAVYSHNSSSERTLISQLKPNQSSVKLLGHIIAINPKEVTVKGVNKKIFYGIIGDESGTITFTSWNELDVDKGDVVEVNNAYTSEWQGAVQLNFGDRVKIEKTDRDRLPESAFKPKEIKVCDLHPSIGKVDVKAKILELKEKETEINGESKKVISGIIGDETGKAQFTSWHDFNLKPESVYNIIGGYVKTWKGIPQLTFDSNAVVKKLDKTKIKVHISDKVKMPLFKLVEKRGALDVEVKGTIIDISHGSGFVRRCPDCNRVVFNNECMVHGKVEGISDFRIKLVIDDGTGAVKSVLNKELSEKILNISLKNIEDMDEQEIFDMIIKKIFAQTVKIQGNALGDEFGTSIIPSSVELIDFDIYHEAEKLSNELGEFI
jgi:replication factor A1